MKEKLHYAAGGRGGCWGWDGGGGENGVILT